MKHRTLAALLLLPLAGAAHAGRQVPTWGPQASNTLGPVSVLGEMPAAHGWIADEEDFICGLENLEHISDPAVVNYRELFEATPQFEEMEEDGIDPESPEGIALRTEARKLIIKRCQRVQENEGYCSVWKAISHEDGRQIANITDEVIEEF